MQQQGRGAEAEEVEARSAWDRSIRVSIYAPAYICIYAYMYIPACIRIYIYKYIHI